MAIEEGLQVSLSNAGHGPHCHDPEAPLGMPSPDRGTGDTKQTLNVFEA